MPTRKILMSNAGITYRHIQPWIIPFKGINIYPTWKLFTSMFFYKGCQYYFVTEYFIDRLISTYVKKSCIIKKSFLGCTQLGLTCIVEAYVEDYINNAIPKLLRKETFMNRSTNCVNVINFTMWMTILMTILMMIMLLLMMMMMWYQLGYKNWRTQVRIYDHETIFVKKNPSEIRSVKDVICVWNAVQKWLIFCQVFIRRVRGRKWTWRALNINLLFSDALVGSNSIIYTVFICDLIRI